jgi:hypothetical protein
MISKLQILAISLAAVLVCSAAGAQVRSGSAPVREAPAVMHARPAARTSANSRRSTGTNPQAVQQANVIQISPDGHVISASARAANWESFDGSSGVPGLGFDYPHLAAISGGLRDDSVSHGDNGHRGQGSYVPISFGGYPYYPYYDDTSAYDQTGEQDQQDQQPVQQTQSQPQIIVIQQPVPSQQGGRQDADSENDSGRASGPAQEPQAEAPIPEIPDVGDFILVRRDGRILFASIFSVVGTQLQYVTPEGIRHTMAMADLDSNATEQMNEARGTTVQIHN